MIIMMNERNGIGKERKHSYKGMRDREKSVIQRIRGLTKLKPDIVTGANQRMKVAVNRVESFICDFEDVFSEFSMQP